MGVNRKVLLGILIIAGISLIIFYKAKKENGVSESFASSAQPSSVSPEDNKNANSPLFGEEKVAQSPRHPQQVTSPRSGKYSLHISKTTSSVQDESMKRDEYLARNRTGLTFSSSDQNFVLMKLRAMKEKSIPDNARSLGHEMFPIEAQVAQKVIIDDDSYPVVYRESNGRIGLLTGVILIQTGERAVAEKLALNYPMDLQVYDSSIGLASYKVHTGVGLYDVFNGIQRNERIGPVTVEVLDSYKGY